MSFTSISKVSPCSFNCLRCLGFVKIQIMAFCEKSRLMVWILSSLCIKNVLCVGSKENREIEVHIALPLFYRVLPCFSVCMCVFRYV